MRNVPGASSGPNGGNIYGGGDRITSKDMDELWKSVRGEPDYADLRQSWQCAGVLEAVEGFLVATFNLTVERCALCSEVGFKVTHVKLAGPRGSSTPVCDRCCDKSSGRRVIFNDVEINKLSAENDMDPFAVPSQYIINGATQNSITEEYRALPKLS